MNKEEVLRMAQSEKKDEMEVQVRDKSIKWTYLTMVIAAFAFSLIRASRGQSVMDLSATVCLSVFAGQIYRFVKTKDKKCLLFAVITFAVAVLSVIRFSMGH